MKKIFTIFSLLTIISTYTFAQVDVKSGLQLGAPTSIFIGMEYPISVHTGIEVGVMGIGGLKLGNSTYSTASVLLNLRHYFSPNWGIDGFYGGAYLSPYTSVVKEEVSFRGGFGGGFPFPSPSPSTPSFQTIRSSGGGVGIMMGRKWKKDGIYIIDINGGFGRNFERRLEDVPSFRFNTNDRAFDVFLSILFGIRLR